MAAHPSRILRLRGLPPFPAADGTVTLVADPRPDGQSSIRMVFDKSFDENNPLDAHSLTQPVFVDADSEAGFDRAREWLARYFEILGEV